LEAIGDFPAVTESDSPAGFAEAAGVGFVGMAGEQRSDGNEHGIANVATETGDDWPGRHMQLRVIGETAPERGEFATVIAGTP
jgi:hypothetical protein